jgi:uncharacterized protein DUF6602
MTVTVKKLLMKQQKALLTELDTNSEVHDHPTDLGDATELDWEAALRNFLPARYQLAKAKVLDARDQVSEQLDLVIFDRQYCPLWLPGEGKSEYIPAESVYAAFEIKQDLSKKHMEAASKKVASVRTLHRTSAPIVHAGGRIDNTKTPFPIIGGILASRSDWKSPPLGEALRRPSEMSLRSANSTSAAPSSTEVSTLSVTSTAKFGSTAVLLT